MRTRDGVERTTIKATKPTVEQLRVLRRGHNFATLDALLAHLAKIAAQYPELLREGRRA